MVAGCQSVLARTGGAQRLRCGLVVRGRRHGERRAPVRAVRDARVRPRVGEQRSDDAVVPAQRRPCQRGLAVAIDRVDLEIVAREQPPDKRPVAGERGDEQRGATEPILGVDVDRRVAESSSTPRSSPRSAAICSAVSPRSASALTSSPGCASSSAITSGKPSAIATMRTVQPLSSLRSLTSAPRASCRRTSGRLPARTARKSGVIAPDRARSPARAAMAPSAAERAPGRIVHSPVEPVPGRARLRHPQQDRFAAARPLASIRRCAWGPGLAWRSETSAWAGRIAVVRTAIHPLRRFTLKVMGRWSAKTVDVRADGTGLVVACGYLAAGAGRRSCGPHRRAL